MLSSIQSKLWRWKERPFCDASPLKIRGKRLGGVSANKLASAFDLATDPVLDNHDFAPSAHLRRPDEVIRETGRNGLAARCHELSGLDHSVSKDHIGDSDAETALGVAQRHIQRIEVEAATRVEIRSRAMNGTVFLAYIEQMLVPRLRPGISS
ncbi:hypothetical protein [Bosea thiooxidans]